MVTPTNRVIHQDLEVVTNKVVESDDDYKAQLAKYNAAAQDHEANAINEYVNSRVVFVTEPPAGSSTTLADKLLKVPLLKENRRRVFVYDSTLDGVLDWEKVKSRRLNVFAATGLGIDKERFETQFLENVFTPINGCMSKEFAEHDLMVML